MKINQAVPGINSEIGIGSRAVGDKPGKNQRLLEACQEFEAVLWHQILRQARQGIPKSGLLDGGAGEDIFQDFLDAEYANTLSRLGPGSLANLLYQQLKGGEE